MAFQLFSAFAVTHLYVFTCRSPGAEEVPGAYLFDHHSIPSTPYYCARHIVGAQPTLREGEGERGGREGREETRQDHQSPRAGKDGRVPLQSFLLCRPHTASHVNGARRSLHTPHAGEPVPPGKRHKVTGRALFCDQPSAFYMWRPSNRRQNTCSGLCAGKRGTGGEARNTGGNQSKVTPGGPRGLLELPF